MARLRHLINQSLNWQHFKCENPEPVPDVETLFKDHMCQSIYQYIQSNLEPSYSIYFEASDVTYGMVEDAFETESTTTFPEEIWPCLEDSSESELFDLPVTVGCVLNEESNPTTMDFHPVNNSVLLVGTDSGSISLWDIALRRKLLSRNFRIWYIGECSIIFKAALSKKIHVSAKCTRWSPGGSLIGVAFSKHIVQLYTYEDGNDIFQSLEIDAHVGSVNNIAFSKPDKETFVITCGDDKMVKVWDAFTGASKFVFDGHKAPVICAFPCNIKGVNFIFSTSTMGEMRGWMYDNLKNRIAVDDPCCRRMVCAKDSTRFFSCVINEEENSCILEWDYEKGSVKKTYQGLEKPCPGVVHFDTAKNQVLAAGDNHQIKFWDMRNSKFVSSTDIREGLPRDDVRLLEVAPTTIGEDNTSHEPFLLDQHPGLCVRRLSADVKGGKICRMAYTSVGDSVLALTLSGTVLVWKWLRNDTNSMDNDETIPQIWKLENGFPVMLNTPGSFPDIAVPCLALTKNNSYLISGSGGELSLFNIQTFKRLLTFVPSPPQTTAVALYPKDNNIIAIGRSDSTILIYYIPLGKIKYKLEGHSGQIKDLAISTALNTLISSGSDSKICAWDSENWVMKTSTSWTRLTGGAKIQFHQDQVHFLVIHDTALAIYEAEKLQCRSQWFVGEKRSPISCAAFSCDGKMIYACFFDATFFIFDASNFQLSLCISMRLQISSVNVHPSAITVHPKKAYQFALGLSDGTAAIFELPEPQSESALSSNESSGSQFHNA
ncbi:topless-related protein 1 isoform X2 [Beta vulgaris subsp. vulgaris]|uniref:topless-related protein 1 isoform X2 n=1 Tax=Beta vulgaris subsp. vulgaris TaxID=3555 RepID=UPI002546FF64|nr:topless-related protein 1 isoform X2 [Beta vulgaris subsp. vulgaris]